MAATSKVIRQEEALDRPRQVARRFLGSPFVWEWYFRVFFFRVLANVGAA